MIALRWPALRLNHALAAATLACAGLAAWPWLVPPLPDVAPHPAAAAPAPREVRVALPPIANFAAIVERPLFSPTRRPAPGVTAAPGPSIDSRYRLLGIVGIGAGRKAFVAEGARRLDIAEGDTLDGWTVKQIAADRVVLSSTAGEAVLKMSLAPAEPAAAPAAAPPEAPPAARPH